MDPPQIVTDSFRPRASRPPEIIRDTFGPRRAVRDYRRMSEQTLVWQAMAGDLMARREWAERHLKGKHDQSAHGRKGLPGAPGWNQVPVEDAQHDFAVGLYGELKALGAVNVTTENTMATAREHIPEGTRIFRSDGMELRIEAEAVATDAELASVANQLTALDAAYPHTSGVKGRRLAITVSPSSWYREDESGVLGETSRFNDGSAVVRFSDLMFRGNPGRAGRVSHEHPASYYEDVAGETVAHEWGHVTQPMDYTKSNALFKDNFDGLTVYGQIDAGEGYADCFADFMTSRPAEQMPATAAYAKAYGWTKTGWAS